MNFSKSDLKRKADAVALIGFAQTSRDLVPWDKKDMEFWSINEGYKFGFLKMEQITRWFQIHPYNNFMRDNNTNDIDHPKWLQEEHPFPIYMHNVYKNIPSSVRYPLQEIISQTIKRKYVQSSMAYMLGLAMHLGFKRLELYGFDIRNDTEYKFQKPNAEWLLGLAEGRGIEIVLPKDCPLLRGKLYGYEHIQTGFRQTLEFRTVSCKNELERVKQEFNYQKGQLDLVESFMKENPEQEEFAKLYEKLKGETKLKGGMVNTTQGALKELEYLTEKYDDFFEGEMANDAQTQPQ